jgi:hypothetical protein
MKENQSVSEIFRKLVPETQAVLLASARLSRIAENAGKQRGFQTAVPETKTAGVGLRK